MSSVQKGLGAGKYAQRGMGVKLSPASPPIDLDTLNVTANNTYEAPSGTAYDTVIVDVPNTYPATDDFKVIYDGALYEQSLNEPITSNGVTNTYFIGSIDVRVPSKVLSQRVITGTVGEPLSLNEFNAVMAHIVAGTGFAFFSLPAPYSVGLPIARDGSQLIASAALVTSQDVTIAGCVTLYKDPVDDVVDCTAYMYSGSSVITIPASTTCSVIFNYLEEDI